jgi:hypothetical protein
MDCVVTAVSRSAAQAFSKHYENKVRLLGGSASGVTRTPVPRSSTGHASRDPRQPNLRQVHLINSALHNELRAAGSSVSAGQPVPDRRPSRLLGRNLPGQQQIRRRASGCMSQSAIAAATCPSTMLETAPLPPKMKAASIVARFSARNA